MEGSDKRCLDNTARFSSAGTAASTTSASMRRSTVMRLRATDGMSASECQGKRPDQAVKHRSDGRECREPSTLSRDSPDEPCTNVDGSRFLNWLEAQMRDGSFADPVLGLAAFGREAGGWTSNDLYPRAVADVTADRRADIVGFGAAGVDVSIVGDATGPIPFSSTSSGGMLGSTAQLVQATASFGASGAGDTLNKAVSGDDPLEPSFLVAPQRA